MISKTNYLVSFKLAKASMAPTFEREREWWVICRGKIRMETKFPQLGLLQSFGKKAGNQMALFVDVVTVYILKLYVSSGLFIFPSK